MKREDVVTKSTDTKFIIEITQESDWSTDGGYSFEDVTNDWHIDRLTAIELINELKKFIASEPNPAPPAVQDAPAVAESVAEG
ncbi:MAG: hypothetical protein GY869_01100 [Planctomycetes bacterium]|nr:hypothetical protein [Planctomycetota bacterium]